MKSKLLVIGPAWVGDMVMSQVLFALLAEQQPERQIDVLAPAWSQPLLERMPQVTKGLVLPFAHGELNMAGRYQLGRSLKNEGYTQAIVLPNSYKSAFIPVFAGIPVRTGWVGECRYGWLNDIRTLDKTKLPLMIERFAALAFPKDAKLPQQLPAPHLQVSEVTVQEALVKHQLNTAQKILALCPGAEFGSSKRWPSEHYAKVAQAKIDEGFQVWIFGSKNDAIVAEEIISQVKGNCHNLAGKTSLAEAVDLLSLANLVVSNDSGLMHIAAALNRPLIAIYGSSSPEFTPPLNPEAHIVRSTLSCSPCFQRECPLQHHRCMKELLPEQVLALFPR